MAAIQGDVAAAGTAIAAIQQVVSEIDGIQGSIAAAVEQQTATAREMNEQLAAAARTCRDIGERIAAVVGSVAATSEQAVSVKALADELAATAASLDEQCKRGADASGGSPAV